MEDHSHCPFDCEHPQPIRVADVPEAGDLRNLEVCGRCWVIDHVVTPMVSCTPENCPDRASEDVPRAGQPKLDHA